jgi:hypothetical protein
VIRARSTDDSDLEWLGEFVLPQFVEAPGSTASREVVLVSDSSLFQRLTDAGPLATREPVACFAFDNSLLRLPEWQPLDERRVLFDAKHDVFLLLAPGGVEVTILTPESTARGRIPLMRVVREWAMSHGIKTGGLFLHASSFAVDGLAIVLAGEKSAGKTSLLLHALRHPSTAYLSNDRVLVSWDGSGATCTGMPTIATIRGQTLELLPELRDRLPTIRFPHRRRLRTVYTGDQPMKPWGDGRYGLSPAQLARALDTAAVGVARAAAIVFPKVTGRAGRLTLREIAPDAAVENLQNAIFGIGAWSELGEIFVAPDPSPRLPLEDPRTLCRRLVGELPAFECRLGLEAYRDVASVDTLLEGTLGRGAGGDHP